MTFALLLLSFVPAEPIPAPAPLADTGRVVTLPGGTVELHSPIVLSDRDDARIEGNDTTLRYVGPPAKSVITLARCNHGTVRDLSIVCTVPGVETGVLITNLPGLSPTGRVSRACLVDNVRVMHGGYPDAVAKAFAVDSFAAGGSDGNNDHHCFRRCYAQSYREAAFYTTGTQVHQVVFDQCHAVNARNYLPVAQWPDGWRTGDGAYLAARDCFAACNATDFRFGNREQNVEIIGFNSEHSRRFVVTSRTGAEFNFTVRNTRWDGEPVRGEDAIDLWGPGLWRIESSWFAGTNGVCPTLRAWRYSERPAPGKPYEVLPGDVSLSGVTFRQHGGNKPSSPIIVCPTTWGRDVRGVYWQRVNADGSRTTRPIAANGGP